MRGRERALPPERGERCVSRSGERQLRFRRLQPETPGQSTYQILKFLPALGDALDLASTDPVGDLEVENRLGLFYLVPAFLTVTTVNPSASTSRAGFPLLASIFLTSRMPRPSCST